MSWYFLYFVLLVGSNVRVESAVSSNAPLSAANYSVICSEAVDYDFYYSDTMTIGAYLFFSIQNSYHDCVY